MQGNMESLIRLADLLQRRNAVDAEIAALIGRPAIRGHLGEWIAATIFGIELHVSAATKSSDGRFLTGPLAGSTVNVKCYSEYSGLLDMHPESGPEFYLVLTGPKASANSSRGTTQPFVIESVFLFDGVDLLKALHARAVKISVATSVVSRLWREAEIYPETRNSILPLSDEQRRWLSLFRQDSGKEAICSR